MEAKMLDRGTAVKDLRNIRSFQGVKRVSKRILWQSVETVKAVINAVSHH